MTPSLMNHGIPLPSEAARSGYRVFLHIHRWRGQAEINWEALGLPQREVRRLVSGKMFILPPEVTARFAAMETKARAVQGKFAFFTETFGWWISVEAVEAWEAALEEEVRKEFNAYADEICADLEQHSEAMLQEWRTFAAGRGLDLGETERRFRAAVPDKSLIRNRFGIVVRYAAIDPDLAAMALTRTEDEKTKETAARVRRQETAKFRGEMKGFYQQTVGALYGNVLEALKEATTSLAASGEVGGPKVNALRHLGEEVQRLCYWPDADFKSQMSSFVASLDGKPKERDMASVAIAAERLLSTARDRVEQVNAISRGTFLEL